MAGMASPVVRAGDWTRLDKLLSLAEYGLDFLEKCP